MGIIYFSDKNDQEYDDFYKIHQFSLSLVELWQKGDIDGVKNCPEIDPLAGNSYLKCNLSFLNCFIKDKEFDVQFKGSKKLGPHYGQVLEISKNKSVLELFLKEDCHEISLPARWYGYSTYPTTGEDIVWNNFNRKIVVDNRLVLNKEIIDWNKEIVPKAILDDFKKWHLPATYLTKNQMQQYCQSRGKQVMNALIYDAITFYPLYRDDPKKLPVYRVANPWTVKLNNTFLKLKKSPNAQECSQAYVKDCKGLFPYEDYLNNSISWSGLFQSLGGPMEYMRNPINPKQNVLLSSYHFSVNSDVHELGKRGYWDGAGHAPKNFEFGEKMEDKKIDVGFRCFYYD